MLPSGCCPLIAPSICPIAVAAAAFVLSLAAYPTASLVRSPKYLLAALLAISPANAPVPNNAPLAASLTAAPPALLTTAPAECAKALACAISCLSCSGLIFSPPALRSCISAFFAPPAGVSICCTPPLMAPAEPSVAAPLSECINAFSAAVLVLALAMRTAMFFASDSMMPLAVRSAVIPAMARFLTALVMALPALPPSQYSQASPRNFVASWPPSASKPVKPLRFLTYLSFANLSRYRSYCVFISVLNTSPKSLSAKPCST